MGVVLLDHARVGMAQCCGNKPVSYTHLDVYKRQEKAFARLLQRPMAKATRSRSIDTTNWALRRPALPSVYF